MTELGQTSDPVALIPGSAAGAYEMATVWRERALAAIEGSAAIRALRAPDGWEGDAADGFTHRRQQVADAWDGVGSILNSTVDILESYGTTLGWAQQKAGDALAMWAAGEADTALSIESYRDAEKQAGATGTTPAFIDGGAAARSDAQSLLAYARDEVRVAGDAAVSALNTLTPPEGIAWQALGPVILMTTRLAVQTQWESLTMIVNATASAGNVLLRNPDALLAVLGGAGMVLGGGAMTIGGAGASLTGGGAAVGLPSVASGVAVAGAGAGAVGAGATKIVSDALSADGVMRVQKQRGADTGGGRDDYGHFVSKPGSRPWVDKEKQGLDEMEHALDTPVLRDRVRADVDGGNPNGRFYDGLVKNDDGSYTALEVKSGGATKTVDQRTFDDIVNSGAPATARLDGETIRIVEVLYKKVP